MSEELTVNGVAYVRADSMQAAPSGNRAVVVFDRGWIFAGDVTRENGRIVLHNAVNVRRWSGGQGFSGMVADPDTDVVLEKMPHPVDAPESSELFSVPVGESWGI